MLLVELQDAELFGEIALVETQEGCPKHLASSAESQSRGSWSENQLFLAGRVDAHTQNEEVGTALPETSQMLGALRICGT